MRPAVSGTATLYAKSDRVIETSYIDKNCMSTMAFLCDPQSDKPSHETFFFSDGFVFMSFRDYL